MTNDSGLFDAAESAIMQVVKADGTVVPLNETETRTHLIDPVLVALGYRTLDHVRREYRLQASGQIIDYLLTAGSQRVVVEAKPVGSELAAKDGGQLVGYSAQEGIRWALLTNGLIWQVFDIEAPGNWELKKVAELDLGSAHREARLAEALVPLAHFALNVLGVDDSALRAYVHEERVRRLLAQLLGSASSSVVQAIAAEMTNAGIEVDPQEIVGLLKRGTESPTREVLPTFTSPVPTLVGQGFYVFPVGPDAGYPGIDHLKAWLAAGFWGVRVSTPHRQRLKQGDRCCFYATKLGIVAHGEMAGQASVKVSSGEWPGPGPHRDNVYKVPLKEIVWLSAPKEITPELRAQLDAFKGKDPSRPWAWFIQTTNRLSDHDFKELVQDP